MVSDWDLGDRYHWAVEDQFHLPFVGGGIQEIEEVVRACFATDFETHSGVRRTGMHVNLFVRMNRMAA